MKSPSLNKAMLDHRLGGGDYTRLATVYAEAMAVAPSGASDGTPVSDAAFGRKAVTNNSTNFPAATTDSDGRTGIKATGADIGFDRHSGDENVTVVGVQFWSASTGGVALDYLELVSSDGTPTPKVVSPGDYFIVLGGEAVIKET